MNEEPKKELIVRWWGYCKEHPNHFGMIIAQKEEDSKPGDIWVRCEECPTAINPCYIINSSEFKKWVNGLLQEGKEDE